MTFISQKRHLTTVSNKRIYRRRKRRRLSKRGRYAAIVGIAALVLFITLLVVAGTRRQKAEKQTVSEKTYPDITFDVRFLDPNPFSRPQLALKKVHAIVVHYTANPGVDAVANRNYFNNLPKANERKQKKTYASSHFVIGLDGTIVQCIPLEEMAYASNDRNSDTVSIECCHKKENGKFTAQTQAALIQLCTYLCIKFDLTEENLIRHYDVTGKICPKYFVEHPDAWETFKKDVGMELKKYRK
ncbi:MAG: N-acetylmuramoyl-L-alanine amidase [Roseburia sp.]|nr:N-acetylmuramoyl-L-alanine amidase [Roseburia sp.]PWM04323.1 MAG: N-acetylmuramoyl-L-alanine amidase [Clostridiales bacterium]